MPQQGWWIIVTIENSPQRRIRIGRMEKAVAQKVKQALDAAVGSKITDVSLEEGSE